jgi:hypothetical protein
MLGEQGIFVWDGKTYALAVTEWLSLEDKDGMVACIGAVHYNTVKEIRRLEDALRTMAGRGAMVSKWSIDRVPLDHVARGLDLPAWEHYDILLLSLISIGAKAYDIPGCETN